MIALLTCENLEGFVHDEHLLEQALKGRNLSYEWVEWKSEVNWNKYQLAIVRTTWDYFENSQLFFDQLKKIEESSCKLINPYSMMKWNSHKTYLRELSEHGFATVPTFFSCKFSVEELDSALDKLEGDKFVFKPTIGAGAKDTFLLSKTDSMEELKVLEGREVMVQPFVEEIANGEYSLHFFAGEFSHAILKKPKPGDYRSQEEYGSHIDKVDPPSGMLATSQSILKSLEEPTLYARVDFAVQQDKHLLMELELIEPSMYFRFDENSAPMMVDKLIKNYL